MTFFAVVRRDLAIRIPKNFWEVLGIQPKDTVEVTIRKVKKQLATYKTD